MKKRIAKVQINIGQLDRVLRISAGVALIIWAALNGAVWAYIGVLSLSLAYKMVPGLYSAWHQNL